MRSTLECSSGRFSSSSLLSDMLSLTSDSMSFSIPVSGWGGRGRGGRGERGRGRGERGERGRERGRGERGERGS